MKKLLFILLFFACKAQGQIVISFEEFAGPVSTNATSYSTASAGYVTGRLYIALVHVTGATTDGEITVSSNTWTSTGTVGDGTARIQVFRSVATTTVTEAITFGNFGSTGTGFMIIIYEVTGFKPGGVNGADAIGVIATQSATTSANPSLTMSPTLGSGGIASFTNDRDPFGATISGWTEQVDGGYTVPTTGVYSAYSSLITAGPSLTAASSTWLGIGVEIKANIRRRIIID